MKKKWVVGIVLALLIVGGVAVAYRLTRPATGDGETSGSRIRATFLAYEIQPETAAMIKTGTPLYDETGKKCFMITGVSMAAAREVATDATGVLHSAQHPFLKDVVITAESVDARVAWAYIYGRDKILAGANVAIYGDNWKVWTRILTV
jgi:hypothetical protein